MRKVRTKNKYPYIIMCLLSLLILPTYFFGFRIIAISATALITALVCDIIFRKLYNFEREKGDCSSAITALIISLLMPATVSYLTVVIAVVIALGVAKYPFGGTTSNVFNPAAVGVSVVALSFPNEVLKFPVPNVKLGLANDISAQADIMYQDTMASVMSVGGTPTTNKMNLLLGNFTGSIGTTAILVLVVILLFLVVTRIISFNIVAGGLATVAIYAALFPRVETGIVDSVVYELCSGVLLFGFIFMASDPSTSPKTRFGKLLYGIVLALMVMLFRTVGALNVEIVFVLLILNALNKEFDRVAIMIKQKVKGKKKQLAQEATLDKTVEVSDNV